MGMRSFPAGRGRRNLPPSMDQLSPHDVEHAKMIARPRRGDQPIAAFRRSSRPSDGEAGLPFEPANASEDAVADFVRAAPSTTWRHISDKK